MNINFLNVFRANRLTDARREMKTKFAACMATEFPLHMQLLKPPQHDNLLHKVNKYISNKISRGVWINLVIRKRLASGQFNTLSELPVRGISANLSCNLSYLDEPVQNNMHINPETITSYFQADLTGEFDP